MSFNPKSSNKELSTEEILELVDTITFEANNGQHGLKDTEMEVLKGICANKNKTYSAIKKYYDEKGIPIGGDDGGYIKEVANDTIYKYINIVAEKRGITEKIKKKNFFSYLNRHREILATSANIIVEQNSISARKAAEQNGIPAHQAIVVLRGRLTKDNNVEYGASIRVEKICAYLEKQYGLQADSENPSIEEDDVRIILRGTLKDLENLQELFRAGTLKKVCGIPVNDIQILNESLDDNIVQEICSQQKEGLQLANVNLIKRNLANVYWVGANLSNAKLSDANLNNAKLSNANLRGADLFRASLCQADLVRALMYQADLRQANLSNADLRFTQFNKTTKIDEIWMLKWKHINQKAESEDSRKGTNLSGADFTNANLSGAIFINANLSGAIFTNANLSGAIFSFANLGSADLIHVNNVKGARFRLSKGLSEDTRRYLEQQGAIFVHPVSQMLDIGSVVVVLVVYPYIICWNVVQFCWNIVGKILPYIAIAVLAYMVVVHWNSIALVIKHIPSAINEGIKYIPSAINEGIKHIPSAINEGIKHIQPNLSYFLSYVTGRFLELLIFGGGAAGAGTAYYITQRRRE